jgi:hypothetical protein
MRCGVLKAMEVIGDIFQFTHSVVEMYKHVMVQYKYMQFI